MANRKKVVKSKTGRPQKQAVTGPEKESARDRILSAAEEVFSRYPFKAASTRMIAQKAGVEHPLIHYYFGSKEKLFEEVANTLYERSYQTNVMWLKALQGSGPAEEIFAGFLDQVLDYYFQNPNVLQVVLLNVAQGMRPEEIPGHQYVIDHIGRSASITEERFKLTGVKEVVSMFVHSFNALVINYIGARGTIAPAIGLEPDSPEYRKWVRTALLLLFTPWIQKISVFMEPRTKKPAAT